MSLRNALSLILLVPSLAACVISVDGSGSDVHPFWNAGVRGSGVRAEEVRTVGEFRRIVLEASAAVDVEVGPAPSVRVSGDDNLLRYVELDVDDGVLSIDLRKSCDFRRDLELEITTPTLDGFTIEGSGDVRIRSLAADHVELAIDGSGTLRANGSAHHLIGSIEGSGELALVELDARAADLSIEGSGSMEVRVAENLRYSIDGSGEILYRGDPRVTGDIDGSGSVQPRE